MLLYRSAFTRASVLTLLLALPLQAFGAELSHDQSPPSAEKSKMTFTINDNDHSFDVAVSDVIEVKLEFQGGTGYTWNVDDLDDTHLTLIDNITVNAAKEGVVGGPVTGVWCFKAANPGDTVIKMLYYRPWEKKESSLKSFTVRLHIKDKKTK